MANVLSSFPPMLFLQLCFWSKWSRGSLSWLWHCSPPSLSSGLFVLSCSGHRIILSRPICHCKIKPEFHFLFRYLLSRSSSTTVLKFSSCCSGAFLDMEICQNYILCTSFNHFNLCHVVGTFLAKPLIFSFVMLTRSLFFPCQLYFLHDLKSIMAIQTSVVCQELGLEELEDCKA